MRTFSVLLVALLIGLSSLPTQAQYKNVEIVERAQPALAAIEVETSRGTGVGNGFFIDAADYVATNRHVIEDANSLIVLNSDGRRLSASVVRYSPSFDVAIIKVAGARFRTLPLGDLDSVRQGQEVLILGPEFVPGMPVVAVTVTNGIVSALQPSAGLIQIDANVNFGDSGKPVLNRGGEVIGVMVLRLERLGNSPILEIYYAVAVNLVRTLAVDLTPVAIPAPRRAQPTQPAQPALTDFQWAYGPATRTTPAQMPSYTNYCWNQPPLCVTVISSSSRAVSIVASGGPGSVRVTIGAPVYETLQTRDPESKVVAALGKPEWVWKQPDPKTHWLVYDSRGVAFVVNEGAGLVDAVGVFQPGTARTFMTIP